MSSLTINPKWNTEINQVENGEPITGGVLGNANLATRQLGENIFYLKQKTENDLLTKANKADIYTKTETDGKYAQKATTISGYNITDAYTKIQIDNKFVEVDSKVGNLSTLKTTDKTQLVKSINEVYDNTEGLVELYNQNILADANGWDTSLVSDGEMTQKQINDGLESIDAMLAIKNPRNGQRVYVKSYRAGLNKGGNTFVYDSSKANINDGGMIINGWVCQVRPHYLNVLNFGATGDGVTNDYHAFKAISDYVKNTNLKGYTIHLPTPDNYYAVSGQTFKVGEGFTCNAILDIAFGAMQDKSILLQSDNAKIKQMSGQYFGAFDKNTKEKLNTTTPVYVGSGANYDAVKDVATVANLQFILHFQNIKSLIINGKIELDGNRDGMNIGGKWGDVGWQLFAYGIRIAWVKQFDIANINSHHHCCDGIYIAGWNDTANPDKPLADVKGVARNLNSQYNSRQGMSLTGGQNISFYDSTFDNTALPEFSLRSLPQASVDIEAEINPIRNITFYNCYFGRAGSQSMVADSGNTKGVTFYNCQFVNDLGTTVWANKPKFKLVDCYINGYIEKNYSTEVDSERLVYQNCTFTDDPVINPNFTNPKAEYLFIASESNPKLIDCTFNLYKSGFVYSYGTNAKYPILFDNVIVNAYIAGKVAIAGVGTIRLRDYRPQESRTDTYLTFGGGNKITIALDKTDDIGNKFVPYAAYAKVYPNVEDPDYIVFAPQIKKLDTVADSTLTDDTATKLNSLLATLKAKGYM